MKFVLCCVAIHLVLQTTVFVGADMCPDHKTRCGQSQTCCSDKSGGYGCCPWSGATCCSDGRHCCPYGSTCDVAHSRCVRGSMNTTMAAHSKRKRPEPWTMVYNSFTRDEWNAQNLLPDNLQSAQNATVGKICGGGEQTCPDQYTCCPLASGGYGCCPFASATCCSDRIHCCPHGRTCDVQAGRCL